MSKQYNRKTCSFFGHRNVETTDELKQKVKDVVEALIINKNVTFFLFGSRSKFNYLCHLVVSELKEKYPFIKRVAYTCKSESCLLEKERLKLMAVYNKVIKNNVQLLGVEEEVEHKTKYNAGKASYIERNQAMINDSDYCVFYYDKTYKPKTSANSGTKIAYDYATQKQKQIINLN